MSQCNTPAAEGVTSREGTVIVAYHESVQCYFRPETEELVFITACHAGAFEQHSLGMIASVKHFHEAKEAYSRALEAYAKEASTRMTMASGSLAQAVLKTEREQEEKRQALQERLGEFSQSGMSYDEVVELIPVAGKPNRKGGPPPRYAYVKKGYFSQSKEGRKLHTVSIKNRDKKGGGASIYSRDAKGRVRIDTQTLARQLTTLEWPKIKLELKDVLKWSGSDFDPETLKEDCILFEWAQRWNDSLHFSTPLSADVDVSGGAQFMRFVSNVGASAEYDPGTGQASIKGEAKASLALVSGTLDLTAYVPDRLGWALSYSTDKGDLFDMGMLRVRLTPELSGFIGASVQLEGQLQVVVKDDQQFLAGQPGGRLPRFHERRTRGAVFHREMAKEDEGLQLTGEAFAGARIEGSLKGSLQWLKPTPPAAVPGRVLSVGEITGKFTDFCTIGSKIGSLAGAGLGGKFHCTFINGKFCFHVAASLCWGAGAKGGFIAEVGVNAIVEFGTWLIYQLYRLDYGFFDVVDSDSFNVYSQYCVLQWEELEDDLYKAYGAMERDVKDVADSFNDYIKNLSERNQKNREASARRNKLAANIIANPNKLLHQTPEAKGVLLYLLTRHGVWDHLDLGNRGDGFIPDLYQQRKEALLWVLKSIQTRAEWRKVLSRMTPDGSSLAGSDDESAIVERQEQQLVDFLQEGLNRDDELHEAKAELAAIHDRLKIHGAWGYALAMNHTIFYELNSEPNPHYPQRCAFGPCDIEAEPLV